MPGSSLNAESQITLGSEELAEKQYATNVNPQWVRLLKLLQMNVRYERCNGAELFTTEGETILDFLAGYCVHNAGHNHPAIIEALKDELDRRGPAMLQSHVPERAGELAQRLCRLAGGSLSKVFFCSSGSEAVEAAIKFSRAHTGRDGLLYASGAFHGLYFHRRSQTLAYRQGLCGPRADREPREERQRAVRPLHLPSRRRGATALELEGNLSRLRYEPKVAPERDPQGALSRTHDH